MITYTTIPLKQLFFCLLFSSALAQFSTDVKVGLILSGGGAKGMAHVGVLKEIERAGVRIDYIGGTSMGAIVGGLYACGYSAAQIESLLLTSDLNALINDDFNRDAKSFPDKEDSQRYAITFPIVNGNIRFPASISKGQNVYNLLVQLMHDERNVQDFSKLPIPFYCVATDINTGEKVLLEHGYLPLAINASSTLPTLFSPVTVGNRSLVDGGISDNYPIEEMQKKGVDVIIGVDVQTAIPTTKAITASEILVRIGSFQTEKTMAPKKVKTDIYIQPELEAFNMLSFSFPAEIIALGQQAANKAFLQLLEVASRQKTKITLTKNIPTNFDLNVLSFPKTPNYKHNYLTGKIRLQPNTDIPFKKLRDGMTNLAATQNFDTFRYTVTTQNNQEVLELQLTESPYNTLFRGSLHYNDLMGASALVNITQKHALLQNDEASLDIILGEYLRYQFSYFIDKGLFWSIGFSSNLDHFETTAPYVFNPAGTSGTYEASRTRVFSQKNLLYVQTVFRETAILGAGISHQKNNFRTNIFDTQNEAFLEVDNADYYSAQGFLRIDSRDDPFFPTKGGFFDGKAEYFFSQKTRQEQNSFSPFLIGKAEMGATIQLKNKLTLSLNTTCGFSIGNANTPAFDFFLGGYGNKPALQYQPFVGLPQQHVGADSYVKGEMVLDYEWINHHHIRLLFHAGIIKDDIFSVGDWVKKPDYFGAGLAYSLDTFAGPLEFTTAYSPQFGKLIYHVSLGWRF